MCKAFPKGIPRLIRRGKQNHDNIINGQDGTYIFTPNEIYDKILSTTKKLEKKVLDEYSSNKIKLVKLILEYLASINCDLSLVEEIEFYIASSFESDNISTGLLVKTKEKKRSIVFNDTEYFPKVLEISNSLVAAEMIKKTGSMYRRFAINLIIYPNGKFEYRDPKLSSHFNNKRRSRKKLNRGNKKDSNHA